MRGVVPLEREPDISPVRLVELTEGRERDDASVFNPEPPRPVLRGFSWAYSRFGSAAYQLAKIQSERPVRRVAEFAELLRKPTMNDWLAQLAEHEAEQGIEFH
jgi:hypothetical protein